MSSGAFMCHFCLLGSSDIREFLVEKLKVKVSPVRLFATPWNSSGQNIGVDSLSLQPTPVFFLENPRDGGAWRAAVYGATQSWIRLKWLSSSSLSLFQGIFPTQGSNPGRPHCRRILYQLSHKGSPRILEWVAYPFSRGSSQSRNQTRVSCIAGGFLTNWAIRETLTS